MDKQAFILMMMGLFDSGQWGGVVGGLSAAVASSKQAVDLKVSSGWWCEISSKVTGIVDFDVDRPESRKIIKSILEDIIESDSTLEV
jgi:hypothetical protein